MYLAITMCKLQSSSEFEYLRVRHSFSPFLSYHRATTNIAIPNINRFTLLMTKSFQTVRYLCIFMILVAFSLNHFSMGKVMLS
jgi:hypothetical protein